MTPSDKDEDDVYRWDDGQTVGFDAWANDEPKAIFERWDCSYVKTGRLLAFFIQVLESFHKQFLSPELSLILAFVILMTLCINMSELRCYPQFYSKQTNSEHLLYPFPPPENWTMTI
jgi:hypothetical protein